MYSLWKQVLRRFTFSGITKTQENDGAAGFSQQRFAFLF
jgi:hypothetical protein